MFGTIKKAMAVAAVVAVGAVAPSVASADQWTVGGSPFAGAAHVAGNLTLRLNVNGATTTCDVTATLDLSNPLTDHDGNPSTPDVPQAHGQVTSFLLGVPAGGSCTTSLTGCSVTATANTTTPWTVSTSGTNVTISGISFSNTYSGTGCAQAGLVVTATGSITGQASAGSNVITFTNAAGLTTGLGGATVSGSVEAYVEDGTGGPDFSQPIELS